jgi:iron complex outermembrane receptor protein
MTRIGLRALLLVGAAAIAAPGSEALAQASGGSSLTTLQEVVVTARRREENLQTTPVAITALSASTLEARGVVNLVDVSHIAPNMQIQNTPGSLGSAGVSIRGIGYGDNVLGQDSPIGVYVDGIAYGRISTAVMDLVEPDRVEVLRGPQGTLFGRNTTAGAILITTHTPSDQFGGEVKGSYGTYSAKAVQARLDTGLIGDSGIKLSMAYAHRQQDGSQNNLTQPRNLDPGALTSDAYWVKAVGNWGALRASLAADYSELSGIPVMLQIVAAPAGLTNFNANSPNYGGGNIPITGTPLYTINNYASRGLQHIWNQGVSLTLEYKASDLLTVKSITGLRAYKRSDPAAYGPANLRGPTAGGVVTTYNGFYDFTYRLQSQRQVSEELQALGSLGDFDYVAGVYYFHERGWDAANNILPFSNATGTFATPVIAPRYYTVDSKSLAGFAQVDWRPEALDKKLEVSGGIRWTKDKRDFNQTQALVRSANLDTKNTSFLVSVNYQWTPGLMTYAKYSTGYRAGGFNVRAPGTANPVYQPEKIKSSEIGFKLDALDRRVRLNGAAFYNKYSDLQVSQFQPPGASSAGGTTTVNANAKFKGFELEFLALPVEHVTVSANFGYIKPTYKNFPRALDTPGAVTTGCRPISNAAGTLVGQDCASIAAFTAFPKKTADFGISYEFPRMDYGLLSARADYSYRGHTEWGAFNVPSSPFKNQISGKSYGLLSSRIALSEIPVGTSDVKAQIAVFGHNLTNEKYNAQGIDFSLFGTVNYGERRTFGVEAKVDF